MNHILSLITFCCHWWWVFSIIVGILYLASNRGCPFCGKDFVWMAMWMGLGPISSTALLVMWLGFSVLGIICIISNKFFTLLGSIGELKFWKKKIFTIP